MKKEEINYLIKYYLHLLPLSEMHTIKYPYLNEEERENEEEKIARIIIEKHEDRIFWNRCPKCGKLARTPKAKQCRFCQHDWH